MAEKLNSFQRFSKEKVLIVMALKQESNDLLEAQGFNIVYTGLGLINAATALTLAVQELKPDRVINLGTAGSFTLNQGDFVEVKAAVQRGSVLSLIHKKIELKTFTDLKKAFCGSADFIEPALDENSTYDIMDMECFAYATVCQNFKVPFHSFKYITDSSDKNTLPDWKKNLVLAQAEFVKFCHSLNS